MSIQSEIIKLDAVRDALVVSVNAKGAALSGDATLWQVKNAVDNITADTDVSVVTQPAPTISINSSTGKVTATYTPNAGLVTDTSAQTGTLQLTVQAAQTITPGTSNKTIAAGRYLTGVQTIKGDANLTPEYIKSGVSIFGVTGSYSGGTITLPETTALPQYILKGYTTIRKGDGVGYEVITGEMTTASTVEVENELNFTVSSTVDPTYVFDDYTVEGKGVTVDPAQSRATARFYAHFKPGEGDVLALNSTIPGYFEYSTYAEKTMEGPAHLEFRCAPVPLADGESGGNAVVEGPLLVGSVSVLMDTDPAFQAENIKKGVSMWGVMGTYEGGATADPIVPESCVVYLGSNGNLYVKQGSGITVIGLTLQSTTDRAGWDPYTGLTPGVIEGSFLSKDGVYLQWDGFDDINAKWSLHSLMNSGYREGSEVVRYAWGFDRQEDQYGSDYTPGYATDILGFPVVAYAGKPKDTNMLSCNWYFPDDGAGREVSPVHCVSYGFSWDGNGETEDSKLYYYGDHYHPVNHTYGCKKLYEPPYYDETMGGYMGNAYRYSIGNKLYLGKPSIPGTGPDGLAGVMLLKFAIELQSYGGDGYVSPFFTGKYKNI